MGEPEGQRHEARPASTRGLGTSTVVPSDHLEDPAVKPRWSRLLAPSLFPLAISGSIAPLAPAQTPAEALFVRADANADGRTDISDVVFVLFCSFSGIDCSICPDAADANDDGATNTTDAVYLLDFLFREGPEPLAPHDGCGLDATADGLGCASFPPCVDPDAVPTAKGSLLVTPIDHATLVLQWDGKTIYADPVGGAARFRDFPPPDIILVTDIHSDHMDGATLRAIGTAGTVLVVPKAVSDSLAGAGGAGASEVKVLANGATATVHGILIEAVPMYNTTAGRTQYHAKGRGNGYVLDLAGTRVYISGDTEDIPEMRALSGIDLAFLCMNLPFTMTPQQAASAALEFKPGIVYPYHYRGQDTKVFEALVQAGSDDIEVRLRNWYP